jgi:hypothetical protein
MSNVSAGTGVTISHTPAEGSTGTVAIGQSVATSAEPSFDGLTITGNDFVTIPAGTNAQRGSPSTGSIRYSSTDSTFEGYNGSNWGSLGGVKDVDGDTYITAETTSGGDQDVLTLVAGGTTGLTVSATTTTVAGNLTVSGTTTTINTETINLADNTIVLNSNEAGTPSQDGGIEIERGTSTNKSLLWDETNDKWTVGSETLVAGTFEGPITGNVTGTTSSISNHDTDSLSEGSTNLYYTNARSRAALSASGSVAYNSSTGVISFTETYGSAAALLTAIKTVDGTGSGLDADTLDGITSANFLTTASVSPTAFASTSATAYATSDYGNLTNDTGTAGFTNEPIRATAYQDLALPGSTVTVNFGDLT